jgi:rhodanese-related sulfurtransferase
MTHRMPSRTLMIGAFAGAVLVAGAAILFWIASPALTPWTLDPADPRVSLEDVEREVIRRYPVPDIVPATLAAMLSQGDVTLFDVRTLEEFEAGHLPGAIRIEPGSSAADILAAHRDRLDSGPVVFYCSVGVRSSQIMLATLRQIEPYSRAGAYNLRGGVFRWTAEGRTLVKGTAQGEAHPFNESWGQLLARTAAR